MKLKAEQVDIEQLKKRVPLPRVLSYFGIEITGNIKCWWHNDSDPSCQVFEDHSYCYGCKRVSDIFSYVMKHERLRFEDAIAWILNKEGILPQAIALSAPKEYKGAVPRLWIDHWHRSLEDGRAQYLYDRLITRETIDLLHIGYSADKNAYTIPFWSGMPGWSEVETFQYRAAPESSHDRKYWGERGYVKPSIINRDLINPELVILVFGTLDAVLGRQDGLPMISTNGAEVFSNPNRLEFHQLKQSLLNVKQVIVLPDATMTEFESAHRLINNLIWEVNAKVKYFPYTWGVKDYNSARMKGYSVKQFTEEVLEMPWVDGFFFALSEKRVQDVINMWTCINEGRADQAVEILQIVAHADDVWYGAMRHAMMMTALKGPYFYGGVFTSEEWKIVIDDLESCENYKDLVQFIVNTGQAATNRLGGF